MDIKKSAYVGDAVNELAKEEQLTFAEIGKQIFLSDKMVGHMKNDVRPMQQETARRSLEAFDSYGFTMRLLYPFSDGSTSPVFDGPEWEDHRNTAKLNTLKEIMDVIKNYEPNCLTKSPQRMTTEQWESVVQMMREYIEARTFIDNFLIVLEKTYNVSVKQETLLLMNKWTKEGWLKHEH